MRRSRFSGLFLLALAITVAGGCRTDFTDESNATESLLGVLDKVEKATGAIDSRLVEQYIKDINEKCIQVQNGMVDTLDLTQADTLVDFCALDEHMQDCLNRKQKIDAELVRTRNQLFNLRTDLKEGRANKDSTDQFIEQEFLFVESLNEATEQLVAELNGCFSTYNELKDEIDRFIIALPSKGVEE